MGRGVTIEMERHRIPLIPAARDRAGGPRTPPTRLGPDINRVTGTYAPRLGSRDGYVGRSRAGRLHARLPRLVFTGRFARCLHPLPIPSPPSPDPAAGTCPAPAPASSVELDVTGLDSQRRLHPRPDVQLRGEPMCSTSAAAASRPSMSEVTYDEFSNEVEVYTLLHRPVLQRPDGLRGQPRPGRVSPGADLLP